MLKSTISRLRGEISKFRSDPVMMKSYTISQEGAFGGEMNESDVFAKTDGLIRENRRI
jgi:hypothetical protein